MKKLLALLLCIVFILTICGCSNTNSTDQNDNNNTSISTVDTHSDAMDLAEKFIKKNVPKYHHLYSYYTENSVTPETQRWRWNTTNHLTETSSGWIGTIEGDFQITTYGGANDVTFSANVNVSKDGTVSFIGTPTVK